MTQQVTPFFARPSDAMPTRGTKRKQDDSAGGAASTLIPCVTCTDEKPPGEFVGNDCCEDYQCNGCYRMCIGSGNTNLLGMCQFCRTDVTPLKILTLIFCCTEVGSEDQQKALDWFVQQPLKSREISANDRALIHAYLHEIPGAERYTYLSQNEVSASGQDSIMKCYSCRQPMGMRPGRMSPTEDMRMTCYHKIGEDTIEGTTVDRLCMTRTCARCDRSHDTVTCPPPVQEIPDDMLRKLKFLFHHLLQYGPLVYENGYVTEGINASTTSAASQGYPTYISCCPGCKTAVIGFTQCGHMRCPRQGCGVEYCRRCGGIGHSDTSCRFHTPPFDGSGGDSRNARVPVPMTVQEMMDRIGLTFEALVRMMFSTQVYLPHLVGRWSQLNDVRARAAEIAAADVLPESLLDGLREAFEASEACRQANRPLLEDIYRCQNARHCRTLWDRFVRAYQEDARKAPYAPSGEDVSAGGGSSSNPSRRRQPVERPQVCNTPTDPSQWPGNYAPPNSVDATTFASLTNVATWDNVYNSGHRHVLYNGYPYQSHALEPAATHALEVAVRAARSGDFWAALRDDALRRVPGLFELIASVNGTGRARPFRTAQAEVRIRVAHRPGRRWIVYPSIYVLVTVDEAAQPQPSQ